MSDFPALVAAVAVPGDTGDEVLDKALQLRGLARRADWYWSTVVEHEDTAAFRKRLDKVSRVKTESASGEQLAGKARLQLEPNPDEDEPEFIETDWLSGPWAWRVAQIAKANVGHVVTVWRRLVDPTPTAPKGHRQVVWIEGPEYPSDMEWERFHRLAGHRQPQQQEASQPRALISGSRAVQIEALRMSLQPEFADRIAGFAEANGFGAETAAMTEAQADAYTEFLNHLKAEPF